MELFRVSGFDRIILNLPSRGEALQNRPSTRTLTESMARESGA